MKTSQFIAEIFRKFPSQVLRNVFLTTLLGFLELGTIFSIAPVIDIFLHPDLAGISAVTKRFMDIIARTGFFAPSRVMFVVIFLIFNLFQGLFAYFVTYSVMQTKYALERNIMNETYKAFFNAKWYFFATGSIGTMLNTFNRESSIVGNALTSIGIMFSNVLRLAFFSIVPLYISWRLTLIALTAGIVIAVPMTLAGRIGYRLGRKNIETGNIVSQVIQESFGIAKVILGFGNQSKNCEKVGKALDDHIDITILAQTLGLAVARLAEPFVWGAIIFVTYLATYKYKLPLAEAAIMAYAFIKIMPLINNVASEKNKLLNFLPSYEQIKKLISTAAENAQKSGTTPFNRLSEAIEFKGVSFAYPGNDDTLKGIDATIGKGRLTAFVGDSGAGKSTLVDMMIGFYEPVAGSILIDGVNLFDYDIVSFRKRIGYVPQDSILFNDTVRNNLLWSKDDATQEEIVEACKLANAHDFIIEFPLGYDTSVGERGVLMSGGQRQRVALARALLRKPELLILDEATSSLDSQSEMLIQNAIDKITHKMTIVIIAHRLSTIMSADWIYVLSRGRIAEEGRFNELIARGGVFSEMAKMQGLVSEKENHIDHMDGVRKQ